MAGGLSLACWPWFLLASADGYIEDAAGSFDWAAPDEEVLRLLKIRWGAASGRSPTASVRIWSCWARNGSQAVLSTSGTGPRQRDHLAR
jgi:hypothetical protein